MKGFITTLFLILALASTIASAEKNNFLVISDIHLDLASPHVMEITPSSLSKLNDLDRPSFEKLMSEIASKINNGTVEKPNFVFILGDLVGHIRTSPDSAFKDEAHVFKVLKDTFPQTPIFYTFGNNDSLKLNYGPFNDLASDDEYKNPFDIAKYEGGWSNGFLSTGVTCKDDKNNFPCLLTENIQGGYYSAYLKPKFRFVSLNSIQFSPRRSGITAQDAKDQLDWLSAQLEAAKAKQESVLIAMHIPPGNNLYDHSNFWVKDDQDTFLKIINTYKHQITGILASHTHAEEIKIIKDAELKPITGVYYTAALSTSHGNEPSIKTFYFSKDAGSWVLSNFVAFHFSSEGTKLLFSKLYDYQSYYCSHSENTLFQCLTKVTIEKIDKYYAAGNVNYKGEGIGSPEDLVLVVPE